MSQVVAREAESRHGIYNLFLHEVLSWECGSWSDNCSEDQCASEHDRICIQNTYWLEPHVDLLKILGIQLSMRANEVGERVHNFFAPDNLSQGQHHRQVVDGNWPVLGNNPWVASQRHIGGQSSNPKNFNLQQSDSERGHSGHSLQVPHGLNFTQSTPGPDFAKSQSQSPRPNLNGYNHEHQVFQTRQNEANFLGVDSESDQCNIMSRRVSVYESQQGNGPEHHTKISVRSETSESPVSFDFFGDQQQLMSGRQPGMLQSLPQQQSGFNDMQQILQQQIMFRKMQELQRMQQLEQLEARQQNSINQISSISKQESGNHSPALINSPRVSEAV
ncbi:hypothetical protein F0562_024841 [Nyssa sinensis]|uniref:Uncharacterized protein n=1 Tax=Nyssa sinensis TaxID=561372 RepID=A0A5J5BIS9_9ASTE|nr:hypothetical protein F0562_024841 [Nyssa sinensis]